jgi:hypothetical protein
VNKGLARVFLERTGKRGPAFLQDAGLESAFAGELT